MHAPSPQQQPEPRPTTVAGCVRFVWRKIRQALRPTNPFRTAKGIAVTGPSTGSGQAPSTGSGQAPSTGSGQGPASASALPAKGESRTTTPTAQVRTGSVSEAQDGPAF